MRSIGNSGARSSGPTGSHVAGCNGGGGGSGRSGMTLYQWVGISDSPSSNLVCSMASPSCRRPVPPVDPAHAPARYRRGPAGAVGRAPVRARTLAPWIDGAGRGVRPAPSTTPLQEGNVTEPIIAELEAEWASIAALTATFTDEEWELPTDLPGWTVRD